MASDYVESDLPPETITHNEHTWERERFDTNSYQWVRELDDDEYDWDPEEDDISLVGTDVPIRVVSVQFRNGEWRVEAAETAGPTYHRPGFTELISSDYAGTFEEPAAAFEAVKDYIQRLS